MYLRQTRPHYVIEHKIRFYITIFLISISILFISFIYYFDKVIAPTVLLVADAEMRAKTMDIINKNINEIYTEGFADDIVEPDVDELGKIKMIGADTIKLNELATKLSISAQKDIEEVGSVGVKIPLGYAFQNNILAYFGPEITVKMEPIGRIQTSYESTFESAGINQTRHVIYINLITNLKIVLPLQSREVEVKHQIPISDNVIIGEVPRTSMGIDAIRDALGDDSYSGGAQSSDITKENETDDLDNIDEDINPLEEAGEINLPDVPDLGVEFGD